MNGVGVGSSVKDYFQCTLVQSSSCTHVVALKFRRLTSPQHAEGAASLRGKKGYKLVSATISKIFHSSSAPLAVSWQCCVFSPDMPPAGNGYCSHSPPGVSVSRQRCLTYKSIRFCLPPCLWLLMSRVLNLACWHYGDTSTCL